MIMDRGIGSRIWDMDGNEYVDYLIAVVDVAGPWASRGDGGRS